MVRIAHLGSLQTYQFVVVFARYQGRWVYCRAKTRDCFETAGGHIEAGETTLDAAERELYEETGAVNYRMTPVFDYAVYRECSVSHGQVFFAELEELGELPDYEMAEVRLFDTIPDRMRFPQILPILFDRVQGWLNLQSAQDEIWDVYDENRDATGRTHRRGDLLASGDYHLVVHVWIMNSNGEFLITQRAPNKGYSLMWECTGGSAISGDDSLTAAIREVKEEVGLALAPKNGVCMLTQRRRNDFCDIWLFRQDFEISEVVLQQDETVDARWASPGEIRKMTAEREFVAFDYLDELFTKSQDLLEL
jgi:8-oxo-dGTP pyrophosphatase MutT (NUDIX family)